MKTEVLNLEKEYSFSKGEKIVVGCSGGPDSMALLTLLLALRDSYDLFLIVAHINHNVRKESKEEEEYLKLFCHQNHLLFESMTIEKYGDDNFHNEARNIRYQFFEEIIHKYHADTLMTAHHADDLMETILMRMVRGSNLQGYSGFHRVVLKNDYKIVRPLLSYTKEEILDFNQKNQVKYFVDSSNKENKYTRNRYRKEILPFLKKEDSAVHMKFLKFSEILTEANSYIEKETKKALKRVMKDQKIVISSFLKEESFIQKEILYSLFANFYQDDLLLVNDKHIELIYRLITNSKANLTYNLPNEVIAIKNYDFCYLERQADFIGCYEIEFDDMVSLPNGHQIVRLKDTIENGNDICLLNSEEVALPLTVRTRHFGDRMTIKGMKGSRKIKDIFIDCKINPKEREVWPVVVDARGEIVWLPGLKKSKFNKTKTEKYDIIMKYQ